MFTVVLILAKMLYYRHNLGIILCFDQTVFHVKPISTGRPDWTFVTPYIVEPEVFGLIDVGN